MNNIQQITRPHRLEGAKDEDYHVKWGRWIVSQTHNTEYQKFLAKCQINWNFYKGGKGQWIFEEDQESFFMDETGGIKNRIRISENMIKPMVRQFLGNAIRLDFNAEAVGLNDEATNKMEEEIARMTYYHDMEKAFPELGPVIRDRIPLAPTLIETEEFVRENPQTIVKDSANALLKAIKTDLDAEDIKVTSTKYIAMFGLSVYEGGEYNASYRGKVIPSYTYFWDTAAREKDLSDAEFMGSWEAADVPAILEAYRGISQAERKALEDFARHSSNNVFAQVLQGGWNVGSNRPIIYKTFWKDCKKVTYAWIRDKNGYVCFDLIDDPKLSDYTSRDMVKKSELTDEQLEQTHGKMKDDIYIDILRCCKFIPKEDILASGLSRDIVLEFGEVRYQEKYSYAPDSVNWPYKVATWDYENGEVLSPIDDAIDPQRMINRMLAVQESHINNSHGSGSIIASEAVEDQEDATNSMNNSKPLFIDAAQFGGVHNAIGEYSSNLGKDSAAIEGIRQQMKQGMQDQTGVNEAMTGTMGTANALVGVVNEQINRGAIVQEPFYFALTKQMTAIYSHMLTVGKKIYADNPKKLAMMVGDRGKDILVYLRDIDLEDWRLNVERVEGEKTRIQAGDEAVLFFLQMQMLSPELAAQLLGRATIEQVHDAVRSYTIQLSKAKAQAAEQQQQQQMMQAEIENAQGQAEFMLNQDAQAEESHHRDKDRMADFIASESRNATSIQRDQMKLNNANAQK